jgi:Txe/YoeB family toxin of toxin-antitoxin system
VSWRVVFTKQAQKDARKIARAGLKSQTIRLLKVIQEDPYRNSPPFEKLLGDLAGAYSRRINVQHRLVYQVLDEIKTVKIIRLWTHYK